MHFEHTFQQGEAETLAFHLHNTEKKKRLFCVGLSLVGVCLVLYVSWDFGPGMALPLALAGALLFYSLVNMTLKTMLTRQVRQLYEKGERKPYQQQLTLDGFGLTARSGKKSRRFDYDKLFRADETDGYFFLYVQADLAYTLSKAQLEQPKEDCALIREILRTFVVSKKLHLQK